MPSAARAKLEYEAARTAYAQEALTDSGDETTFTSNATYFSRYEGEEPVVRPNGVVSGLVITPSSTADTVNISAGTIYYNGAEYTIAAGTD